MNQFLVMLAGAYVAVGLIAGICGLFEIRKAGALEFTVGYAGAVLAILLWLAGI